MPWITVVLGMADAPSVDYDSKKSDKKKEKSLKTDTVDDEVAAIQAIFG